MSKKKNPSEAMADASSPGWGWIAYSSGVTAAILLSDLSQKPRISTPQHRTLESSFDKLRWVQQAAGCITSSDYYGIGYNNGDGNYKLVRFTCRPFEVEGFENVPEVEVYEFETSSWRTVGGKVDVDVEITRRCVSVMGNMYWVAYRCWKEDSLSLLQQDESSRKIEVWVSSKLGDGDVSFSKYFSLSGPDLPALQVHDEKYHMANPVYCFVKPKRVTVWCVEVEGEGTDEACTCCTLYEIGEDGVKSKKVTERDYVRDYSRAFVCGYVYVPSMIPLPWIRD
ncbi:hypothetical protein DY000_02038376 [Brassica cretica]|uniref:F-box associated domain-containing protein n=1 Tax=Brassica cretica TaxID=69181 RepID=A0ABQ7BH04_BRACR|nr:hypothetical protein DY000_02038376 [Brassica cretica]